MIVGVDPGTTVAFAAVDLNGKIVSFDSKRDAGKEWLVKRISEAGTPAVICCDVAECHGLVLKIAAFFNCRVYSPERSLSESEKRSLTKGVKARNAHELDATAAALKAFNVFSGKLRKVERELKEKGREADLDEAKFLVLNQFSLSDALELIGWVEEEPVPERQAEKKREPPELVRKRLALKRVAEANLQLRKRVEFLEAEKKVLEDKIRKLERGVFERLKRDKELKRLESHMLSLKAQISRMRSAGRRKSVFQGKEKRGLKSLRKKGKVDLEELVEGYREERE